MWGTWGLRRRGRSGSIKIIKHSGVISVPSLEHSYGDYDNGVTSVRVEGTPHGVCRPYDTEGAITHVHSGQLKGQGNSALKGGFRATHTIPGVPFRQLCGRCLCVHRGEDATGRGLSVA